MNDNLNIDFEGGFGENQIPGITDSEAMFPGSERPITELASLDGEIGAIEDFLIANIPPGPPLEGGSFVTGRDGEETLPVTRSQSSAGEVDNLTGEVIEEESPPVASLIQRRNGSSNFIKVEEVFNSGYFVADESGELKIDYLHDGTRPEGELAIFSLENFDKLNLKSKRDFIKEAASRVLSNSELGYVLVNDKKEGAYFGGWANSGEHGGVKSFNLTPGDKYGLMLVPNGTVKEVLENPNIGGNKKPLFSLKSEAYEEYLPGQQFADVNGNGQILGIEASSVKNPRSDRDYDDSVISIEGLTGTVSPFDEVIKQGKDWRSKRLGKWLDEYVAFPKISFDSGYFVADETGELKIDYLYDGTRPEGELAIFSLDGLDELNLKSERDFIKEAASRVLSNSEEGYVLINDKNEGAFFDGWANSGEHGGVKSFNLTSGDEYGLMLVPNGTVKEVLENPNLRGNKKPLFSLKSEENEEYFPGKQFADVMGNGEILGIESSPVNHPRSDRDYEDFVIHVEGLTGTVSPFEEVIKPGKDWRNKRLGKWLDEYFGFQKISFDSGYFVADETGELKIDYLYDGTRPEGELAVFSLEGLDELNLKSESDFIKEAASRVLSNSERGYVLINDKKEGALFDGWANSGEHQGVKSFNLTPGDEYALMLVPNGTVKEVFDRPNLGGNKKPLFSLASEENEEYFPGKQFADVMGNGEMLGIEASSVNNPRSDGDYEDLVVNIEGLTGTVSPFEEVITPGKDWRELKLGRELINSVKNPPRPPFERGENGMPQDLFLLTDLLYNPGETPNILGKVSDTDGGGDIARIDFWLQRDGGQWKDIADVTEFVVDGDEARFDYQLAGLEPGKYRLKAIAYDNSGNSGDEVTEGFTVLSLIPEEEELSDRVKWAIQRAMNLDSYDPEALAATREWVVSVKAGESAAELAESLGWKNLGSTGHIPNTYIWEFPADVIAEDVAKQLNSLPGVEFAYPQVPVELQWMSGPADEPLVKDGTQWHLRSGVNVADANVTNAWEGGVTGEGVVIGVVDDGFEIDDPEKGFVGHPDLLPNYRADLSYDFDEEDPYPSRLINGVVESQQASLPILSGFPPPKPRKPLNETISVLDVPLSGFVKELKLELELEHKDFSNLDVTIVSPGGTEQVLTNLVNGINVIELTEKFLGHRPRGGWELRAKDKRLGNGEEVKTEGELKGWSLEFETINIHGTAAAGVAVAAGDNNVGGSGVAPEAEWAGLRINAGPKPLTGDVLAKALSWENQEIDIYSNSFGPGFFQVLPGAEYNLEKMTQEGRDGKGNIYAFAGGNGADAGANVNYNSLANSRYSIAVAAIDSEGKQPSYSEPGASLLVSAYSDNGKDRKDEDFVGITTTGPYSNNGDDSDDYIHHFTGTSASTPFVAAGVGLMLEANPNLTVRDVQHILVETANQNDSADGGWVENGAGYWVNHKYGFGAINVEDAVELARNWKPVNKEVEVSGSEWEGMGIIPDYDRSKKPEEQEFLISTIAIDEDRDISVEWAEVVFNGEHRYLGELEIVLISPDGTESVLASPHTNDKYGGDGFNSLAHWTFTSARHWGESSVGEWKLRVADKTQGTRSQDNRPGMRNFWTSWQLNFFGTEPNTAPEVTNLNQELNYTEEVAIALKDIVITDPDTDDTITVSLELNNPAGGTIASGGDESDADGELSFEGSVAEVNGWLAGLEFKPAEDFSENLEVTVTVTDNNISWPLTGTIKLVGESDNDPPTVANPIADQTATEGRAFELLLGDTFADVDDEEFNYSATVVGGGELPSWLSFDGATGTFSGVPKNSDVGEVEVKVSAADAAGGEVSDEFVVTVETAVDLKGVAFIKMMPGALEAGDSFNVGFMLQNTETAAAGAFDVGFYLSEDGDIDESDRLLHTHRVEGMAGFGISPFAMANLTLPDKGDEFWNGDGSYFVGMVVDVEGAIAESNEDNNANAGVRIDLDSIEVNNTNTPPTLTTVSTLTGAAEREAFTISYEELLAASDAADAEGDTLTFQIEGLLSGDLTKDGETVAIGETVLAEGEEIVWTPYVAGDAVKALSVKAFDGKDYSDAVEVAIAVEELIPPKLGEEFQVNTYTGNHQDSPVAGTLSDGGFVVAWRSLEQDGSGYGVYGQRYDRTGKPIGKEFQANTYADGDQSSPSVAGFATGGFVLTWSSEGQDGSQSGIFGQLYDESGNRVGNEFMVNTKTSGNQLLPSVKPFLDGGFAIVWHSEESDSSNSVYGRRYDSGGNPVGDEFLVDTYPANPVKIPPEVAVSLNGHFMVTWSKFSEDGSDFDVFGQRYESSGDPIGDKFQINSQGSDRQYHQSVTAFSNGGFMTVWESNGQDGSDDGIFGQRYRGYGTLSGQEFQINTYTNGKQTRPSVTALRDGGYVVTWESEGQDGSSGGIFGQRFDVLSNPVGQEFQINTYTNDGQSGSSVTPLLNGDFVVTWSSSGQDGDGGGIYAKRFGAEVPNTPPALTNIATLKGATESQPYTITYENLLAASDATDIDGDPLAFQIEESFSGELTKDGETVAIGETVLSEGEEIVWTPNVLGDGVKALTVKVFDGEYYSAAVEVQVEVEAGNTAPTLTDVSTLTGATEGEAFTITYNNLLAASDATDADNDALTFQIEESFSGTLTKDGETVAPGATVLAEGEEIIWTSTEIGDKVKALTVKAFDGKESSDTAVEVTVAVIPPPELGGNLQVEVAQSIGGISTDPTYGIATDNDGNVWVTGYFWESIDVDGDGNNDLTSNGSEDSYVAKFDRNGNLVFAKNIGGSGLDRGWSIATDNNGNGWVAGEFSETIDIDGDGKNDLTSNGKTDGYVAKFDSNGDLLFAQNIGSSNTDRGYGIATDSDGNVWVTGLFAENIDIDGDGKDDLTGNGWDSYVAKFDSNGNFLLAKNIGSIVVDVGYGIATDSNDNVWVTGEFRNTIDIDGDGNDDLTSNGDSDSYVAKFDSNGNFVFAKNIGGSSSDVGWGIATDNNGNAWATGYFSGSIDIDGDGKDDLIGNGDSDSYVAKFDSNGNLVLAKNIGSNGSDRGYGIATDDNGNVWVTGEFTNTIDIDKDGKDDLIGNGDSDSYVAKFDSNGNLLFAQNVGGSSRDVGRSIATNSNGDVWATGYFQQTIDTDGDGENDLTSNGYIDSYVIKFSIGENENTAPTLTEVSTLTGATEGEAFTITYDNLLAASNATDADGDVLTFQIEGLLSGELTKDGETVAIGETVLAAGEEIVWTPDAAGDAVEALTVKAFDGKDYSDNAVEVAIAVEEAIPIQPLLKLGDEFQIDIFQDNGKQPSVTATSDGGFVATWQSGFDIFGQRYDSSGNPIGYQFQVNSWGDATYPFVASLSNGGFVVTWHANGQDANQSGVSGQLFDKNGNPVGEQFPVNTYTDGQQRHSSVTALSDGGFVVTWQSQNQDGNGYGVYGQRYDGDGNSIGNEFQVNTYKENNQINPSSIPLADGGFAIVWTSYGQDGSNYGIYGQRYDSSGNPIENEFQVNTYTDGYQAQQSVTSLPDGGFVVTWRSDNKNRYQSIHAQRYDVNVNKVGNEVEVIPHARSAEGPSVTSLQDGGYVVTWYNSSSLDGFGAGVFGQRVDSNNIPVGEQFLVNTYTDGSQWYPSITSLANGKVVVTWQSSAGKDGNGSGLFAQFLGIENSNAPPTLTNVSTLSGATEANSFTIAYEDLLNASDAKDADGNSISFLIESIGSGTFTNLSRPVTPGKTLLSAGQELFWTPDKAGDAVKALSVRTFDGLEYSDEVVEVAIAVEEAPPIELRNYEPVSDRFLVNTYQDNAQEFASIAALSDGGFVVTWTSQEQDGSDYGIYAQRYASDGAAIGDEFQVNTHTQDAQHYSSVVGLADGGFVIVWESEGQDGSETGVYGQRYDRNGDRIGDEFQVNTNTFRDQGKPFVIAFPDGGFLVTWKNISGQSAKRFDSNGKSGAEFTIEGNDNHENKDWSIAPLADGGFVAIENDQSKQVPAYVQRYDKNGLPVGEKLEASPPAFHKVVGVQSLSNGGFVALRNSLNQETNEHNLFVQQYDSLGQPVGGELQVNDELAPPSYGNLSMIPLANGAYAITWRVNGTLIQRFDGKGNRIGNNEVLTQNLINHPVTALTDYSLVIAGQSSSDIYAQRFGVSTPNTAPTLTNIALTDVTVEEAASPNPILNADNGNYYEFVAGEYGWQEAKARAEARTYNGSQGYLATITSEAEQEFVSENFNPDKWGGWIGASDAAEEGVWQWETGPEAGTVFLNKGTTTGYHNFAPSQPNDFLGFEEYAHIRPDDSDRWNDVPNNMSGAPPENRVVGYYVEYGGLESAAKPGQVITITFEDLLAASDAADAEEGDRIAFQIAETFSGQLMKYGEEVVPGETLFSEGEELVWIPGEFGDAVKAFSVKAFDWLELSDSAVEVVLAVEKKN